MSSPIDPLISMGLGACIWCFGKPCPRNGAPLYLPAAKLAELFGGRGLNCEQASRRLVCSECGARGRDGKVSLAPSTLDVDDVRLGREPGTSEARVAAKRGLA